jgi:signal transduction histidine kinase
VTGPPARGDLAAATGFFALLAALILVTPTGVHSPAGRAAVLVCAAVQAAGIALMRRRPELAMAVGVLGGVGIELLSPDIGWLGQAAAVLAFYARLRPPSRSLWVLGLLVAATPWKLVHGDRANLLLAVAGPALGWTLGELSRTRALRRQDQERRVLAQERQRIARELHDVLAHTVSVILVQAGAAEDIFDSRPDLARQALGSIDRAARSTLAELRVLLQTMSADEVTAAGAPQPGLAELATLAASLQAAGLRVELDRDPDAPPLPPTVDLSAYRIVQESLTNTLRHSQATRARVVIRQALTGVRLEISDDGPARAARPAGRAGGSGQRGSGQRGSGQRGSGQRGIVGMRERARLLGGTLDAGPRLGGGFQVRAELPVERGAER